MTACDRLPLVATEPAVQRQRRVPAVLLLLAAIGCDQSSTLSRDARTPESRPSSTMEWRERILPATPGCLDCTLELQGMLTIRPDASGQFFPRLPWTLADSRGRFVLAAHGGNAVLVFDSSGRFQQAVGRVGRGPGELLSVGPMTLSAGDSLFVAADQRRINVYAPSGAFARQTILQFTNASCLSSTGNVFAPLSDGRLAIGSSVLSRDQLEHPIALADADGQRATSFGVANTSTIGSLSCRAIVADPAAGVLWALEPFGYRLEELQRSPEGRFRTVRQLGVRAPWFREGEDPFMTPEQLVESLASAKVQVQQATPRTRPTHLTRPPSSSLRNVLRDAEGRLWLAWRIAAPRWDTVTLRYPLADELSLSDELDDLLWHTVLDVVDTRSEALLVRDTFPFHGQLAAPGVLAHPRYSPSGGIEVDVYRFRLASHH